MATPFPSVSVVIPTLSRPAPLARAVASVAAQALPPGLGIEVVVVDNSPGADARAAVAAMAVPAGMALRYASAPKPGVATARNAGVALAAGDWIAFLDDDEEAAPDWLAALLAAARSSGADAVFGPVRARAEEGAEGGALMRFFSRAIERPMGADITDFAAHLGTNNSLFSRAALAAVDGPFDTRLDSVGGEDSLLLRQLAAAGRRFAWAPAAAITEWVPPRRLTWSYVRRRRFLSGQIRTLVTHRVASRRAEVALWMAAGAVQCGLAGAAAALLWPLSRDRARHLQAVAWGGAGKVLWARRFGPGLYGAGLVS